LDDTLTPFPAVVAEFHCAAHRCQKQVPASLAAAQEVLPKPEEAFKDAKIGRTYKDSKPGTMALTKAPAGAPNVLIILIDDSGFGQWGTFGGQVPTYTVFAETTVIIVG
jgi:hypothetical protein